MFRDKQKFIDKKEMRPYLNIAQNCSIIALGSGLLMFFIPVSGWRPSFLSLVFLVIASTTLFRAQELAQIYVINKQGKSFLKFIGYSYLIMTVSVSLWCNYINWDYWLLRRE